MFSKIEQQIADDLLTHTLDLFRLEASLRNSALSLLQKMQKDLRVKLSTADLTAFNREATQRLLVETSAVIEDYYQRIKETSDEALNALPQIEAQAIRASLAGVGYGAALAPPIHFATAMTDIMIQGAPSAEWWSRQKSDTQFRFSNVLRQGIVQGKTNQQIIAEILGKPGISKPIAPSVKVGKKSVPVTMPKLASEGSKFVWIDVEKFDKTFEKETSFYIGSNGQGGIRNRYAEFGKFFQDAKSIEASEIGVSEDGSIMFGNGRHRYAWLRDQGVGKIPVVMDEDSIRQAKKAGFLTTPPTVKTAAIGGVLEVSRRNAAALVQTSIQTVANVARLEAFAQNADIVKGVKQISTLDSHTTDICIAYSGMAWNLEGKPIQGNKLAFNNGPPRHWNCRSILIPITKTFKELGIDTPELKKSTRASTDGQIDAGTTFDSFLKRKGEAFQNEILGPGRAKLWRDKKITLQQLLDLQGNPLSLSELQAKYARPY